MSAPKQPAVSFKGPTGSFLVELLTYNGAPFHDHWALWVSLHDDPNFGVYIHATGDVRNGFTFELKRSYHLDEASDSIPTTRIPLQWVDAEHFDEKAMFNDGKETFDHVPVCEFETSVHKVEAPKKSLNSVGDQGTPGKKIVQRDCQTWIVEAADQLVQDGIFNKDVAAFLHSIQQ
ncbi:hypothetical protein AJ79_04631 [Helicocarpus griseus UAMH5409]|uniref:Uncharacterized protein n=1 Tax=Helicocarpus griseus UAMH5409 TaxID=1447875 RepID=A0A2B7XJC2_9EURO|nr:hypothetical protein AJ79_04631 [Helicocarpus griseus UAMH5409]